MFDFISLAFLLGLLLFVFPLKRTTKISITSSTINLPLPPSPKPWPLIGNLPEIRKNTPVFRWIHSFMNEINTDIASFRLANTHVITITSPKIAREILKKQDSIFATRPLTMGTECSSRGYLTIAVVPQGEQWKKMRKIVSSHIGSPKNFQWTLEKIVEESDNLMRYIYKSCIDKNMIDLRLAVRQYSGNVARKMMFGVRHFGKGSYDGSGPGFEEIEHVESLFKVLKHLYAFAISDYVPWLRLLDLEGHERIMRCAMKNVSKFNDCFVDERVLEWRNGKRKEAQDLLDMFIKAKDSNGEIALTEEEIKAQVTVYF